MPQSRSMAGAVYSGRRKITFLEIRLGEVWGGGGQAGGILWSLS